jgi:hypothetical protein
MEEYSVSFNARPHIDAVQLKNGQTIFVVDNALDRPERLVKLAHDFGAEFVHAEGSPYPGSQLLMPDDFSSRIDDFFRLHIRSRLKGRRSLRMYSRLSRVTMPAHLLDARQRICHRDSAGVNSDHTISASVLYLFDNPALGGTVFFEPVASDAVTESLVEDASNLSAAEFGIRHDWPPSYMTQSNAHFRVIGRVPAKWNRVIFYDGRIFHSSDIEWPELLDDPAGMGRLTVNAFFTCTRPAQ